MSQLMGALGTAVVPEINSANANGRPLSAADNPENRRNQKERIIIHHSSRQAALRGFGNTVAESTNGPPAEILNGGARFSDGPKAQSIEFNSRLDPPADPAGSCVAREQEFLRQQAGSFC
jgi:hypothetical protein